MQQSVAVKEPAAANGIKNISVAPLASKRQLQDQNMTTESDYGLVAALGTVRPAMYSCREVCFD